MDYEWAVIGAGLQGSYFSALISHYRLRENCVILDDQDFMLQRWLRRTYNCRMKYMRSTSVHHLSLDPASLLEFASYHSFGAEHFTQPYLRPSLALFNAHCQDVLRNYRLEVMWQQARLLGLKRLGSRRGQNSLWQLRTSRGELRVKNLLLALGDCGPAWPWPGFTVEAPWKAVIHHLSAMDFDLEQVLAGCVGMTEGRLCILGGGISAAQLVHYLLEHTQNQILWLLKREIQNFQFDSEPAWLLKNLDDFQKNPELKQRWEIIARERHKGSVPPELWQQILQVRQGRLSIETIEEAPPQLKRDTAGNPILEFALQGGGGSITAHTLICASGLNYQLPDFLLDLAREEGLGLLESPHGPKPALRDGLEWAPGLFLTGRLAELFLGPAAGNIGGARVAGRYLQKYLEQD